MQVLNLQLNTIKDCFACLDSDYKVSGDDFYMFGNIATIPVGTITIQETKAPTGYFINNEVFVRKIEANGKDQYVSTYNQPTVNEKVIKFDIKKVQAGTSTPVSGAVFRHTLPNGSTEDLETNSTGEITITGLASGTHKIKEIKSPDGYQLNPNEVVFNVASSTGKITFTSGTNSLIVQGTKDSGDGYATFADKVNPFNLKITKTNEHGKVLKGAEFRLYSDENCTNEVYVKESPNGYVVMNRDSLGGTDHTGGARPSSAVEMASDAKGVFTILGLDQGTYYLKETDSPAGYRELQDPIVITIKPTFTDERNNYNAGEGATDKTLKTLEATAHVKEFLNGAYKESDTDLKTDVTDGSANITVVNYVGTKLPITGSNLTMICLGAGTITVVGALALNKKRKKANKD